MSINAIGKVCTGEGVGSRFVGNSWARQQMKEKLGFDPYLGTLNICLLESEAKLVKDFLKSEKSFEIVPSKGYFKAHCFRALIMGKINGAIVFPDKPNYPSNILELLAPVNLRDALSLEDDDEIKITIFSGTNYGPESHAFSCKSANTHQSS